MPNNPVFDPTVLLFLLSIPVIFIVVIGLAAIGGLRDKRLNRELEGLIEEDAADNYYHPRTVIQRDDE